MTHSFMGARKPACTGPAVCTPAAHSLQCSGFGLAQAKPERKSSREPHRESCCWLQDSDCEMDSDYEGSGISDFQEDEMTPMVSVAVCMPGGAVATVLFACAASV